MGVISVRLNKSEEHVLAFLTDYFEKDRSSIIKESINEKYEDLQDMKAIKAFEKEENAGKTHFISSDEILSRL
jgi:predicted transcriptional regulator